MAYRYIERVYGTTFKPGDRVRHTVIKKPGEVIRATGDPQYYRVRFDGQRHAVNVHPGELEPIADTRPAAPATPPASP